MISFLWEERKERLFKRYRHQLKITRRKHPETEHTSVPQLHRRGLRRKMIGVDDKSSLHMAKPTDVIADNAELRLMLPV